MRFIDLVTVIFNSLGLWVISHQRREFTLLDYGLICLLFIGLLSGILLAAKTNLGVKSVYYFWCLILGLGVLMLLRRIWFVILHGGMDTLDTPGSPMAFLIGLIFEQVFITLPALVIVIAMRSKLNCYIKS